MSEIVRPSLKISTTIQDIVAVGCRTEFIELLSDLTLQLHLKHFWHMIAPNKFKPKKQALRAVNNFPNEFEEDYIRGSQKAFNCPVLGSAYQYSQKPILWRDMIDYAALTDEQNQLMKWYSRYGINTGICFPIHEPGSEYAVLTFILDESKNLSEGELSQIKHYLMLLSNIIHQKYRFFLSDAPKVSMFNLTARETECLVWAARGKTAWETAQILGISEYTVSEYLTNVMKKFKVSTKVAAVSKAILANEIYYTDVYI